MNQEQAKIIIKACPTQGAYNKFLALLQGSWRNNHYHAIEDLARDGVVLHQGDRVTQILSSHRITEYSAIPKRRVNWLKLLGSGVTVPTNLNKNRYELVIGVRFRLYEDACIELDSGIWYPEDEIILKDLPDEYYEDIE